jgi:hypothetical protein
MFKKKTDSGVQVQKSIFYLIEKWQEILAELNRVKIFDN